MLKQRQLGKLCLAFEDLQRGGEQEEKSQKKMDLLLGIKPRLKMGGGSRFSLLSCCGRNVLLPSPRHVEQLTVYHTDA